MNIEHRTPNIDGPVKSSIVVIPDLIRDPEVSEITGFRPSPE
jgi:hypothetical protein